MLSDRGRGALLATTVAALAAFAAPAYAETVIYTEVPRPSSFQSKPDVVGYGPPTTPGLTIKVKELRWRGWGERKATAKGRGRVCASTGSCERPRVRVKAKGRYRTEGPTHIYSKIRFKFPRDYPHERELTLCIAGEVCDQLGPIPRHGAHRAEADSAFASGSDAVFRGHRGSAPHKPTKKARRRAKRRWPSSGRIEVTDSYRSKRNRRWVLVNGTAGGGSRSHLWSAWLRKRHGGWHMYRFADFAGADPSGAPCDIRPAYSEPRC